MSAISVLASIQNLAVDNVASRTRIEGFIQITTYTISRHCLTASSAKILVANWDNFCSAFMPSCARFVRRLYGLIYDAP